MNRYTLLFVGFGLVSTLLGAEDLGQKINSYAVKDGKIVWKEDRFGNRTEFEYDRAGQLVNTRRSGMSVSGNVYKDGLLKEQKTISGAVVKMNYDAQGRLIEKQTFAGKSGLKYDKYGRLVERNGGAYPLKLTYTGWGELASYTDNNGATTKFEYDFNGRPIKRIWPDGTSVKYVYAGDKLMAKEETGRRKTIYKYDDFGRLLEEKIVQGKESLTTNMAYDNNGRITAITDGKTTVKFAYDRFGRKLLEDGPVGTITMKYDEKGRLSARQVQFKGKNEKFTTEYKYDEYDRVVTVKSSSGEFHYTWTKDNKIATQSVGDKQVVNTYDKAGRLVSKTFGDTILAKYEYDELNRRVKGQYFDVKWDYSYDQYNQLIGAKNSNGESYQYEYDSIGNRLKAVENGKTRDFTYNKLNQISNDGYAYDAWGNMTKTPKAEYTYDLKNRLVEIKQNDGTVIHYEYDPLAQRITSTINGKDKTAFLMSGMIEYARHNGKSQYHTLGLDLLCTLEQTGAVGSILATNDIQYLYDGNGNVIAPVFNGTINDKLTYTPFGRQIMGRNLPFTFSSKSLDKTNLNYYGFRFYDSFIAKWEKRDPIHEAGSLNLYAIVINNLQDSFDILGLLYSATIESMTLATLQNTLNNNWFGVTFTGVQPTYRPMDYVREWQENNCWCAQIREGMAIDLEAKSFVPTNNIDRNGNIAYAVSAIADINAHERRRRIAMEKGYNEYFRPSQQREAMVVRCGKLCKQNNGEAKALLASYLVDLRSAAVRQYNAYINQEQNAIDLENNHWLRDNNGLLTGYDPAYIHNPVAAPAFVPPECPK